MDEELDQIAGRLVQRIQKHKLKGRTITLKIRFNDFSIINRGKSFPKVLDDYPTISRTAKELLAKELSAEDKRIRLLGITLSNFNEVTPIQKDPQQLRLF